MYSLRLEEMVCVCKEFWVFWRSINPFSSVQFSSVQSLSHVCLFVTPWIAACQASLSITNYRSLLKLMSIESVMLSSHLIFCCPLLFLPPIPPSIRVFSIESTLHMRWPKYWSFSFSISPSNEHPGLISFRMDWLLQNCLQLRSSLYLYAIWCNFAVHLTKSWSLFLPFFSLVGPCVLLCLLLGWLEFNRIFPWSVLGKSEHSFWPTQ